ncbi:hypothetical protein BDV96DRAFT_655410 [Lophiotrema nucula]|uniref:Uncharacterized protein n=1 Tax=Lophiotrema nucula TaxID=690887 RepID=A0A6A5YHL7_9PLEO|nr:hypothetical protein BDV96DRAFT_655410 [Lophiotrema nucula]
MAYKQPSWVRKSEKLNIALVIELFRVLLPDKICQLIGDGGEGDLLIYEYAKKELEERLKLLEVHNDYFANLSMGCIRAHSIWPIVAERTRIFTPVPEHPYTLNHGQPDFLAAYIVCKEAILELCPAAQGTKVKLKLLTTIDAEGEQVDIFDQSGPEEKLLRNFKMCANTDESVVVVRVVLRVLDAFARNKDCRRLILEAVLPYLDQSE